MASVYLLARRDRATGEIQAARLCWHRPMPAETAGGWHEVASFNQGSTGKSFRLALAWLRKHLGSDLVTALPAHTLRAVTEGLLDTADGKVVAA